MDNVTGYIEDIRQSEKNPKVYTIRFEKSNILYSGYERSEKIPQDLLRAKENHELIKADFLDNESEGRTYHNIKSYAVTPSATGGEQKELQPSPSASKDFTPANELDVEEFVMAKLRTRMTRCKDAITGIYHLPEKPLWTDGLHASANSLFIELNKQMSRYPIIKEAMKGKEK